MHENQQPLASFSYLGRCWQILHLCGPVTWSGDKIMLQQLQGKYSDEVSTEADLSISSVLLSINDNRATS